MQRKNSQGLPAFFDDILAEREQPLFLGPATPVDAPSALHFHKQIELGLCSTGRGIFYIHDEIYPFGAGDISVIYPGESHIAQSARTALSDWLFLTVDVEVLLGAWRDYPTLRSLVFCPPGSGHILSAAENAQILPYLRRIISLYQDDSRTHAEKRGQYEALFACILYESAAWEQRAVNASGTEYFAEQMQQIYPAVQYILNHYAEDVQTEQLCECCRLSPVHLRRLFATIVGVSPIAFLHKIRISHASGALTDSSLSVLQIAEQCGYASLSSFNRQFQKWMHRSPTEYRASVRAKNE